MYWKNITLNLKESELKEVADKLMELDILSVTILDKNIPERSNWFDENKTPITLHSDTHKIILLVNEQYPTKKLLDDISNLLELDHVPIYSVKKFKDEDWAEYTQGQFKEIIISEKMRIIPPWHQNNDFKGATITIDPGSGFGIGSHPTTRLCLKWLEEYLPNNDSFLDFGTGSGILSIAAMSLGAKEATGIDIDYRAIKNAKHNSKLNGFDISFYNSHLEISNQSYDTVCANILSNILIDISSNLKHLTNKRLILSGILNDQTDKVISAYSEWIDLRLHSEEEDWVLLEGELKS